MLGRGRWGAEEYLHALVVVSLVSTLGVHVNDAVVCLDLHHVAPLPIWGCHVLRPALLALTEQPAPLKAGDEPLVARRHDLGGVFAQYQDLQVRASLADIRM